MGKENIKKMIDINKMDVHAREVLGAVVGLAKTCGNNPYTDDTIKLICDILLRLYTNCDVEGNVLYDISETEASQFIEQLHKEKYNISPSCAVCQARCGNTDDYDISLILDEESDKLEIKEELIYHAVKLAGAAHNDNSLYFNDEYRLVFIGVLTVLSYDMSMKGLENAALQTKKWEMN